jgi:hypothetical protein
MAEQLVSPGVFSQEIDQSYLTEGVGAIGACVIGPTQKGPAFWPTQVTTPSDFIEKFGDEYAGSYVPATAKYYLKNAGTATIVRVLGEEGWIQSNACFVSIQSASYTASVAILIPTIAGGSATMAQLTGSKSSFIIQSSTGNNTTASFAKGDTNFIGKIFGTNPSVSGSVGTNISKEFYLYKFFADAAAAVGADSIVSSSKFDISFTSSADIGSTTWLDARTPMITSQLIQGQTYNLFQFGTIPDGNCANALYKIGIADIKIPVTGSGEYGTFTVVVRDINDTDTRPNVLETYPGCTLDPTSPAFVVRQIGDRIPTSISSTGKITYTGNYPLISKRIYMIPDSDLETVPAETVPFGHVKYYNAAPSGSAAGTCTSPNPSYVTLQGTTYSSDTRIYFGFDFAAADNNNFLDAIPSNAQQLGTTFSLSNMYGHPSSSFVGSLSSSTAPSSMLKFVVAFQGGWDGMAPNKTKAVGSNIVATNVYGFNCSTAGSRGTTAYKKAINCVSNPDEFDLNLLLIPGIIYSLHPAVAEYAISLCETRGDCFYILDPSKLTEGVDSTINAVSGLDTNYAAVYYPWVRIKDVNNRLQWVPPSAVLGGVYAYNDRNAAEWFAPAGLNRGGISQALETYDRLNKTDRDSLYDARVNPIATFPNTGICAYGQKTLQKKQSALDRVNVRRLLINLKKFAAATARFIVFEPNVGATRNRFLGIVNPYLSSVQQRYGLYAFRVKMDETNNTADIIDRNIIYGQFFLQPVKAGEFIVLDFNVMPTGATFSE